MGADATTPQVLNGSKNDVGTSAAAITSVTTLLLKGVTIKANKANSADVWIGGASVTAGDTEATDGIPLSAGEAISLPVDQPNRLYVISSGTNQKIHWLAN